MSGRRQGPPWWATNGGGASSSASSSSVDPARFNGTGLNQRFRKLTQNFQRECKVAATPSSHGGESHARFNNPARRHVMYKKNHQRHGQQCRGAGGILGQQQQERGGGNWRSAIVQDSAQGVDSMEVEEEKEACIESDLPGFFYDTEKKKYFAIQRNTPGAVRGFTEIDLRAKVRAQRIAESRPRIASASFGLRPVMAPLSGLLLSRERGLFAPSKLESQSVEIRLLNLTNTPDSVHPVTVSDSRRVQTLGCKFLDVSSDGQTLVGCWGAAETTIGTAPPSLDSTHIVCLDVQYDSKVAQKAYEETDGVWPNSRPANRLGLVFKRTHNDHGHIPLGSSLVDMTIARVDSEVTCLLYATAATQFSPSGIHTQCTVRLEPIQELSSDESLDTQDSPIYNFTWRESQAVWSCAWNENLTRIGLGLEDSSKIIDIVAEKNFRISSRRRNVLCQHFNQGNGVWMGLKSSEVIFADLRRRNQHETMALRNSTNTGWMRILTSMPESLLTENFKGELKLWDTRMGRVLQTFNGHRNSHYRLPCVVDPEERLLFAVGSDGTTRGWSLKSGDMLCALQSPRPGTNEERADFPRIAFSRRWAGRAASEAVILAVGDSLRVYELSF